MFTGHASRFRHSIFQWFGKCVLGADYKHGSFQTQHERNSGVNISLSVNSKRMSDKKIWPLIL